MAITFYTQSRKQIAPIYIRYREFKADAKARTSIYIDKDRLKGSKVLKYKITAKDTQADKLAIQEKNKALDKIQDDLNALEQHIRAQVTPNKIVDSKWLKQALNPVSEALNDSLLGYYNLLLESSVHLTRSEERV